LMALARPRAGAIFLHLRQLAARGQASSRRDQFNLCCALRLNLSPLSLKFRYRGNDQLPSWSRGRVMPSEWESMSIEELFELHQLMQSVLREKLIAKNKLLEDRIHQLDQPPDSDGGKDRQP
jgi:hypothetical protein